MNMMIMRILEN